MPLYPYQIEDVNRLEAILADHQVAWLLNEQRTGKLIEFIELCRRGFRPKYLPRPGGNDLRLPPAVLVVAPLSTLWNIRDEFKAWLGWPVFVNPKTDDTRLISSDIPFVVAVNREKLRDHNHWIFSAEWDLALFDEAHHYRGRDTAQTRGMQLITAHKIVLATGTPLMSGLPYELYPLLKRTDPARWKSFWSYLKEYATDMVGHDGVHQDIKSVWRRGKREQLSEYLAPFTLRRTYAEVRPDMPPLVKQTIHLRLSDLDRNHYRHYAELTKHWRTQVGEAVIEVGSKLEAVGALRRCAATTRNLNRDHHPRGGKITAVREWVQSQGGKGVVWCWHRDAAYAMAEELIDHNIRTEVVTGQDPVSYRHAAVKHVQSSDDVVLVATISSLLEGITLDTLQWAAFFEVSFNPSDNDQAAARIMGPNQTGSPLVATFVLEDTIETRIERILRDKRERCTEFFVLHELAKEAVHD